jgi:SAM-dependent methyltransferase
MSELLRYGDYDPFAWIYNKYWGDFAERVLPTLEKLILKRLPAQAHILDLCCGTGQLANALARRGYQVTGIDGSEVMLDFARKNAPDAEFIVDDARTFKLPAVHDGVVSTFDSLNHVMTLAELTQVFQNVYAALRQGGLFLFDLNMTAAYQDRWRGSFAIVEDDHVIVVRASYGSEEKIGRFALTIFRLNGEWRRSDLTLTQRCYTEAEITTALAGVGFTDIKAYDSQRELRRAEIGRTFFVCCKPA